MPRSRINGNFIDKTFSIVANILLRIIPTTSGEKEAFTYYRDGVIWFSLLVRFFLLFLFEFSEKGTRFRARIERTNISLFIIKINLRLLKVKFRNRTIPSVVYPRLMQPQILCFSISILVLNERLHLCVLYYRSMLLPSNIRPIGGIGEKALHLATDKTKTLLKIISLLPFFSYLDWD